MLVSCSRSPTSSLLGLKNSFLFVPLIWPPICLHPEMTWSKSSGVHHAKAGRGPWPSGDVAFSLVTQRSYDNEAQRLVSFLGQAGTPEAQVPSGQTVLPRPGEPRPVPASEKPG